MSKLNPVLLAEDNPNDVLLVQQAFVDNAIANPLLVVGNGDEAIRYLAGEGRFGDREQNPFPALFLLDLKMPVKDGLEVLQWLHEHPEIPKQLPVVVFSSSELPEETQKAFSMDIQACIVKPVSFAHLRERIRILKEYWLEYEASP
jgi:CheY-like chemotaxis protein